MPDESAADAGKLDLDGTVIDARMRAAGAALAVHHLAGPVAKAVDAYGMTNLYERFENPLVRVLAQMEHVGIAVDGDELRTLSDPARQRGAPPRRRAAPARRARRPQPQLADPVASDPVRRARAQPAEDEPRPASPRTPQTLEKLRDQWPEFIGPLLQYRELEKLRSTYAEGLLAEVAADGRIHATFNQTVARTGRLSSDRPNLHNIPVRRDEGTPVPQGVRPGAGCALLVADYNQIELRCIAHLAGDPGLIAAFSGDEDIHNATASRVFSVDPADVTLDQRSKAKMVSYGLAYGMESYGLSQRLNIARRGRRRHPRRLLRGVPQREVRTWTRTVAEARERGYTETLFGRRRPIPELLNSNFRIRQAGERQAMNAGIQGLAADIFKVALVHVRRGTGVAVARLRASSCRCTTRCSSRCPTPSASTSASSSSTSCATPPSSTSRST
ncbi:MAG: DNA polymerase [Ilumatobacteraceae bacterium]